MKATTMIMAAVLTLSVNILFASNDGVAVNSENNSFSTSLAPVTPSEATFEEMNDAASATLAPVTPALADFSDELSETTNDISALAPATPPEADFSPEEEQAGNTIAIAPYTPTVADFSDGI
jgi:hypothetical protein